MRSSFAVLFTVLAACAVTPGDPPVEASGSALGAPRFQAEVTCSADRHDFDVYYNAQWQGQYGDWGEPVKVRTIGGFYLDLDAYEYFTRGPESREQVRSKHGVQEASVRNGQNHFRGGDGHHYADLELRLKADRSTPGDFMLHIHCMGPYVESEPPPPPPPPVPAAPAPGSIEARCAARNGDVRACDGELNADGTRACAYYFCSETCFPYGTSVDAACSPDPQHCRKRVPADVPTDQVAFCQQQIGCRFYANGQCTSCRTAGTPSDRICL